MRFRYVNPISTVPLAEISLGQVLLRLFQTSRRFNVEIQPQLVLLQKNLLNVEGLGASSIPTWIFWKPPSPIRALDAAAHRLDGLRQSPAKEAGQWSQMLPSLPRLVHEHFSRPNLTPHLLAEMNRLRRAQEQGNRLTAALTAVLAVAVAVALWALEPVANHDLSPPVMVSSPNCHYSFAVTGDNY